MQTQANISRYRNELKGVAILWIVLFHAKLQNTGVIYELTKLGYGGVDIFMLLTGFGLYRSLDKAPELCGYLKRRAARLLPAYLPFCLAWLAVMLPTFGLTLMQGVRVALGNLTMAGMLTGAPKLISWYVTLLLVAILLAPMVHATLRAAKRPMRALAGWLLLTLLVSVCCWGTELTMLFSRLPIFVLGMGLAMPQGESRRPALRVAAGAASLAVGLAALYFCFARYPVYLNDCGMYWYPFLLITPPLCAGLGWLFAKADKWRGLFAPLRFLGAASFEIFLFNCWAEIVAAPLGMGDTAGKRLLLALASVLAGCAYHAAVSAVTSRLHGKK